ncbi:MAG: TolB family protein, partial [Pyrinomonadaceae bacterium]
PDGSNLKQITFSETPDGLPNCAPDGSFIIYEANSAVWKISSDGGIPVRLTEFECAAPSLSPDAKSFACIQPTGVQIKNALLTVIETESGKIVKTFEVIPFGFYYRSPIWSPDGQSIIFKKTQKQIGNLWRQNLSGGEPKQITNFNSDLILNHSLSRDGKKIILSRGKFTTNVVMLKNFK